jgi:hypothetical protein
MRSGSAVIINNALGQKVIYRLAVFRLVSREEVIECPILSDDDNDMLDGSPRSSVILICTRWDCEHSTQTELE